MFELLLIALVLFTGYLAAGEAWYERDIPWDTGKYFLLSVVLLVVGLYVSH